MVWIHIQTQLHEHFLNTAFRKHFNVAIQRINYTRKRAEQHTRISVIGNSHYGPVL